MVARVSLPIIGPRRTAYRSLPTCVALGSVILAGPVASAQKPPAPNVGASTATIQCVDSSASGRISSAPCTIFARRTVAGFAFEPVMWNLSAYSTRIEADQRATPTSAVVALDGEFWRLEVGPRGDPVRGAARNATIGPIPLPAAKSYEILFAFVAVPPGSHSAIHVQSGPEAWYVLAGSQCVETPDTVLHIAQGHGGMVPADTPLYLVATGTTTRRAFFVIVHDAARPFYTEVDSWHPQGKCIRG
jgi:hypothetical protein